jgi:CheY-like chemotaxis protein
MNKILITEDDPFIASLYQEKFQAHGFEVTVAGDAKTAMRQLARNPPDVVLLDLMLPEVTGVDVLKFIHSTKSLRHIAVVVLSSSVAGELILAARKAGADKFLTKSTSSPRLVVDEVLSVLARRRPLSAGDDSDEGVRVAFQSHIPQLVAAVHPLLEPLVKSGPASAESSLPPLRGAVRTLSSHAGLAGFAGLAQMAGALEVFLSELCADPRKVTLSSLRTVRQVVAFIPELIQQDIRQQAGPASPMILVLDDDVISRQVVCTSLERAGLADDSGSR